MVSTSWPSKESTVVWSGGKSDRRDTRPALSILRLHVQLPMIVANRFLRLACQGALDVTRGRLRVGPSAKINEPVHAVGLIRECFCHPLGPGVPQAMPG